MSELHPILLCDISGMPHKWISYKDYAYYKTKNTISWSIGEETYFLHGGTQRATGEQSKLAVSSIIGVKGHIPSSSLKKYNIPHLTSRTLFERDQRLCAYCGTTPGIDRLTRDHVFPVAKGGETSWMNLVTACKSCNRIKRDRTPEQAGMELLFVPYVPNRSEYLILIRSGRMLADQMDFLKRYVPAEYRSKYLNTTKPDELFQ